MKRQFSGSDKPVPHLCKWPETVRNPAGLRTTFFALPFGAVAWLSKCTIVDMRNPKISETYHRPGPTDARSRSEIMRHFQNLGSEPDERRQKRGPLEAGRS